MSICPSESLESSNSFFMVPQLLCAIMCLLKVPSWKALGVLVIKLIKETKTQQRKANEGNTPKMTPSIFSL